MPFGSFPRSGPATPPPSWDAVIAVRRQREASPSVVSSRGHPPALAGDWPVPAPDSELGGPIALRLWVEQEVRAQVRVAMRELAPEGKLQASTFAVGSNDQPGAKTQLQALTDAVTLLKEDQRRTDAETRRLARFVLPTAGDASVASSPGFYNDATMLRSPRALTPQPGGRVPASSANLHSINLNIADHSKTLKKLNDEVALAHDGIRTLKRDINSASATSSAAQRQAEIMLDEAKAFAENMAHSACNKLRDQIADDLVDRTRSALRQEIAELGRLSRLETARKLKHVTENHTTDHWTTRRSGSPLLQDSFGARQSPLSQTSFDGEKPLGRIVSRGLDYAHEPEAELQSHAMSDPEREAATWDLVTAELGRQISSRKGHETFGWDTAGATAELQRRLAARKDEIVVDNGADAISFSDSPNGVQRSVAQAVAKKMSSRSHSPVRSPAGKKTPRRRHNALLSSSSEDENYRWDRGNRTTKTLTEMSPGGSRPTSPVRAGHPASPGRSARPTSASSSKVQRAHEHRGSVALNRLVAAKLDSDSDDGGRPAERVRPETPSSNTPGVGRPLAGRNALSSNAQGAGRGGSARSNRRPANRWALAGSDFLSDSD